MVDREENLIFLYVSMQTSIRYSTEVVTCCYGVTKRGYKGLRLSLRLKKFTVLPAAILASVCLRSSAALLPIGDRCVFAVKGLPIRTVGVAQRSRKQQTCLIMGV